MRCPHFGQTVSRHSLTLSSSLLRRNSAGPTSARHRTLCVYGTDLQRRVLRVRISLQKKAIHRGVILVWRFPGGRYHRRVRDVGHRSRRANPDEDGQLSRTLSVRRVRQLRRVFMSRSRRLRTLMLSDNHEVSTPLSLPPACRSGGTGAGVDGDAARVPWNRRRLLSRRGLPKRDRNDERKAECAHSDPALYPIPDGCLSSGSDLTVTVIAAHEDGLLSSLSPC
jgi:hypothetical protein